MCPDFVECGFPVDINKFDKYTIPNTKKYIYLLKYTASHGFNALLYRIITAIKTIQTMENVTEFANTLTQQSYTQN